MKCSLKKKHKQRALLLILYDWEVLKDISEILLSISAAGKTSLKQDEY
jgi:hypothetical protein